MKRCGILVISLTRQGERICLLYTSSSVADLINLAQNLDCYEFSPGVEDDETLGRIYVEDMEAIDCLLYTSRCV